MASQLLNSPDTYTAYQFDEAVMQFGVFIDNKLDERDPKTHKPYHTIKSLLRERKKKSNPTLVELQSAFMDSNGNPLRGIKIGR